MNIENFFKKKQEERMAYYPQVQQPVYVPRPPMQTIVVGAPPPIVAGPTVIVDRGRRSGRGWSRSRSRSRSRPKTVYHKHKHSYKPSSRKSRRSKFSLLSKKKKSKSGQRRIKMNIGDEHASKQATQRMDRLGSTGTPLEVFLHANTNHLEELPQNLRLQWAMSAAFKNKQAFSMSLQENGRDVFSSESMFNRQVTERTIDVEYLPNEDEDVRLTMDGTLQFTFNGDEALAHSVAVFPSSSGSPWTSVRYDLYTRIHHETYVKNQLPIAYVTIKFKKSLTAHIVESIVVSVDFSPNHETIVTHIPHIDALPQLQLTPLDVVRWGRESYTRPLHASVGEELSSRFSKVKHDQSSHWQLISNDEGGEYGSTLSREHNVLWGEITDSLLARVIVDDLRSRNGGSLKDLDRSDYLVESLSATENGRALVNLVTRLYMDLHPERTLIDRQDFPTLRQVLRHTSGLPSNTLLDYNDILNYYKTVVARLGEDSSDEAASSSSSSSASDSDENATDLAITDIIKQLSKFKTAEVDPDVVVGIHNNIFEALIVFMYFQATLQRTPLDAINQIARENAIELVWGLDAPTDVNDPLSLLTCAQSSLDGLVKFARMTYNDLELQDSLTAHALLDPVFLRKGSAVARTIGWYVQRTGNGVDIIFSWQGKRSALDSTLVYFIPELRAWGIINEYTRDKDFSKALCFDSTCFIDVLVEAIEQLGDDVTDSRPRHAIELPPYYIYSNKYKSKELIDRHLSLVDRTYRHPFLDPITGKHAHVTVRRDESSGNLLLISIEGIQPLELGYTGHDDVFFKVESPVKNGDEVVVTPEYISINRIFLLDEGKTAELKKTYKSALTFAKQKISMDIHGKSQSHHLNNIKPHTMIASQFFEEPVGRRWGGGGGRGWGWRRPFYRRPYYGYGALGAAAVLGTATALGAAAAYPPPYYYPYPPYAY